jgi:putative membrane protein
MPHMGDATPGSVVRDPDRAFFAFNAVVSSAALGFIAYILLVRRHGPVASLDLRFLPAVNATLNALAATLLCTGYVAIRNQAQRLHKFCMVSAFVASTLFLVCYLAYHFVHGDTKFQGSGTVRLVYFGVLASHILLSAVVVPLALAALYFAARGSFVRHKRVTRIALPIWLYVSVTGVLIYWMLRGSVPAAP